MKKYLLLSLIFVGSLFTSVKNSNAQTLYQCFQEKGLTWSSISGRAEIAAKYGVWQYKGTRTQNQVLASRLCETTNDLIGFSTVSDYSSTLNLPMSSSQTTVPVSSMQTRDGHTLTSADFGDKVFLTIEPGGSKIELVMCTGISGLSFTGCTRGLAFYGTSTASVAANQKTHSPGSRVIMSNSHHVYEQFVDVNNKTQTIAGDKTATGTWTYTILPTLSSGTTLPTTNGQFATKYYVDNVGAGGFTCSNVSTTLGLQCTGSVPEKVGINASSTTGGAFGSDGKYYQKIDTATGIQYSSGSAGIGISTSTLSPLFTSFSNAATTTPTANKIPLATSAKTITSTWIATTTIPRQVLRNVATGATWDTLKTYFGQAQFAASGSVTTTLGFEPRTIQFDCAGASSGISNTHGIWDASNSQWTVGTTYDSAGAAQVEYNTGIVGAVRGGGGASYNQFTLSIVATSTSGFTMTGTKTFSPGNINCTFWATEF